MQIGGLSLVGIGRQSVVRARAGGRPVFGGCHGHQPFQVASGLSIGAGWRFLRREPDSYERLGDAHATPIEGAAPEPYSLHRIGFEFRYAANEPPLLGGVPFPVEVLFRGSKSIAGSVGATVESRAEAMVRFRIRE